MSAAGDPSLRLLRPALELARIIAQSGSDATPSVAPPKSLRPLLQLRHPKLTDRLLGTIRDAVEGDGAFRERVAAAAEEDRLGRVPWLWLARPEGWEDEVDAAVGDAEDRAAARAQVHEERRLGRELDAAQERIRALEAELSEARSEARQAAEDLGGQRDKRRGAEERATELSSALDAMGVSASALEATVAKLGRERDDLRRDRAADRQRIDELTATNQQLSATVAIAEEAASDLRARLGERHRAEVTARSAFGRAVDDAAGAARTLGAALAAAAEALDLTGASPSAATPPSTPLDPADRPRPSVAGARSRPPTPARRPVRLPPATYDDSLEAARYLVAVPRVLVLVDGYNISLSGWADEGLSHQRQALVDRLSALAAMSGADIRVVFDGHEHLTMSQPRGRARAAVKVTFSEAGTDADEDIIALVAAEPVTRPVIVATSDRRVATAVGRLGANVITSAQLLGVLGRNPTS